MELQTSHADCDMVSLYASQAVWKCFALLHFSVFFFFLDIRAVPELVKYKLSSVVVHSGMSAESGHYYCYAKENDDGNNSWCLFNDSHVSLATFRSLSHLTDQFSRDTAYVLFYAKADIDIPNVDGRELIEKNLYKKIEDDNVAFTRVINNK